MNRCSVQCFKSKTGKLFSFLTIGFFLHKTVLAQDGNAGINQANTVVRSYFDSGTNLMYAVGAILGLIGAIKVYQKWNHGDHDTGKVAAAWFGSCIFLVIVATVLRSFFGL
ncbi:MAG TPA: DUF4134 domain-containing protein [Puia sp.]|nr:DUF4134 domain-containing protein [Puia sp.]